MDLKSFLQTGAIICSSPSSVYIGWGKRIWTNSIEKKNSFFFYFPDFFLSDRKAWFFHEYFLEIEISKLINFLEANFEDAPPKFEWKNQSREHFTTTFNELQDYFRKGVLKKGVPFIFETAEGAPSTQNLHSLLKNALSYAKNNQTYIYGFWDQSCGMLGATPELLFHLKKNSGKVCLETVACAGTCPKDQVEGFISDPKQLNEHNLVVDGIQASLGHLGIITKGNTEILHLPQLCHLVTPINLTVDGELPIEDAVRAIHPTPALGAFPKANGMKWLKKYQKKIDRKRFGAPVGYCLPNGNATCYVAIRNVQWEQGKMEIGAGCGVVPQSRLEAEWNEINLKINSIKQILGL